MRIELCTDCSAQGLYLAHNGFCAQHRPCNKIGMTADIFGQRIDREIGPVIKRLLEHRPEQGIVAGDDRAAALPRFNLLRHAANRCDIDNTIGRIGRGFDQNDRNTTFRQRLFGCFLDGGLVNTIRKSDSLHAKIEEGLRQKRFRAAIKWLRMQDDIARAHKSEKRGGNGGHAGREKGCTFRPLIDRQTVLHNLAVRVVEA